MRSDWLRTLAQSIDPGDHFPHMRLPFGPGPGPHPRGIYAIPLSSTRVDTVAGYRIILGPMGPIDAVPHFPASIPGRGRFDDYRPGLGHVNFSRAKTEAPVDCGERGVSPHAMSVRWALRPTAIHQALTAHIRSASLAQPLGPYRRRTPRRPGCPRGPARSGRVGRAYYFTSCSEISHVAFS